MRDDTENVAELELLRAQRAQLASRLKPPWWYVAAIAFAMAVAFAMPIAHHYLRTGVYPLGGLFLIVLVLLLQHALVRVSGVKMGTLPSARAWAIAIFVVVFAASWVETLLLEHGLLAAAIVVGVLAALAGTGCVQGQLRGIRRDLETGAGGM
jgi:hypothetical protein